MTGVLGFIAGGGSLRNRVALKERQLLMHRQAAVDHVGLLRRRLRLAATGPWTLLAAAGLGVMLEQATRPRGDSLFTMLNALTGGRSLLMALLPWLPGIAHTGANPGSDPS